MEFPMDFDPSDKITPIETESGNTTDNQDQETEKKYRMMLSMWLSFCIIGFIWFVSKVLKGRQRIRYNFTSIEEQLKRMQAVIEERERAMAENAITEAPPTTEGNEVENVPKVSPDAQKLLEQLTKAFGTTESEDHLENVDESEETAIENVGDEDKENIEQDNEVNGDEEPSEEDMNEIVRLNRRRKFDSQPMDNNNVELIRNTIEDIIQESVKEVNENTKKDD